MKKISITLICLLTFAFSQGQTNRDISNIYIKRAYEAIESSIDYTMAQVFFDKAMQYRDKITDRRVAILGASIYFETHHKRPTTEEQVAYLEKAKQYSILYFNLAKNKNSDEYLNNNDTYVLLQQNILRLKRKLQQEKQLKKIDSLKIIWIEKAKKLSVDADSIYEFNSNKVALFKSKGFFGVINDIGEILIEPKEYKDALSFDGYIILKNKEFEPTKLYGFDTRNKIGFLLPKISDTNLLSTHYGHVMLPRANGRLVTYPNNTNKPFIYDLNVRKVVNVSNLKEVLKKLKRADIIDRYKNDGRVKVKRDWYVFGGNLDGGIYPLYASERYKLEGFLSANGKFLNATRGFEYIGYFHNNKAELFNKGETSWINQNGTKVSAAKDEYGTYSGGSIVIRSENGMYHILKDNMIVSGAQKLEKLPDYLRKFAPNN